MRNLNPVVGGCSFGINLTGSFLKENDQFKCNQHGWTRKGEEILHNNAGRGKMRRGETEKRKMQFVEQDKARSQNMDKHAAMHIKYTQTDQIHHHPLPPFSSRTMSLLINSCFPCYEADGSVRRGMQTNQCPEGSEEQEEKSQKEREEGGREKQKGQREKLQTQDRHREKQIHKNANKTFLKSIFWTPSTIRSGKTIDL